MDQRSPLEKQFNEMLADGNFTALDSYKNADSWDPLSSEEKRLLALLFIAQAKQQLKQGDKTAFENLYLSTKIAPHSAQVYFCQAEAFASQLNNVRCLLTASKLLEVCGKMQPESFETWHAWGAVLGRLGNIQNDAALCVEANKKFKIAEEKSQGVPDLHKAVLYWRWGACLSMLGQFSGEPVDFQQGIEQFSKAFRLGLKEPEFLSDYGNMLAELAMLVGKGELYIEAAKFFEQVVERSPDSFQAWLNLACCYQRIFLFSKEDQYFNRSNEAFAKAESLNNEGIDLWLNWGRLLVLAGKWKYNVDLLQASFEKFVNANECEPNNPFVLSGWAEAQMLCGSCLERVDLLRSAEEKLIRSPELASDNADIWGIYGTCLTELGRYFSEESYYLQAIEKFRYGLSLQPRNPLLWYGKSLAHFAVGDMHGDIEMVQQSVQSCSKVIELGGEPFPQFWNDWGVALMKLAELTHDQRAIELAIEKFERAFGWQSIFFLILFSRTLCMPTQDII